VKSPPKETGALAHAPKAAELLRIYLLSLGVQPGDGARRCVGCGCRVDNANLGSHARKSALGGCVSCYRCA
jgi:hypothetical protein